MDIWCCVQYKFACFPRSLSFVLQHVFCRFYSSVFEIKSCLLVWFLTLRCECGLVDSMRIVFCEELVCLYCDAVESRLSGSWMFCFEFGSCVVLIRVLVCWAS